MNIVYKSYCQLGNYLNLKNDHENKIKKHKMGRNLYLTINLELLKAKTMNGRLKQI